MPERGVLPGCCGEVPGVVPGVELFEFGEPGEVEGDDDGVDVGAEPVAAKAKRFGDSVPALVTMLGVAAVMIADMTVDGDAVGIDDKYLAARPAT